MSFKLEICSFDLLSALLAQDAGAHRIELCAGPAEGGTTPGPGTIRIAREKLHIDLYPIIRPRGGDFLYTDEEYSTMVREVEYCKQIGCNGVVIGILQKDGTIDKRRASRLVELAYPLGVTFHRAFDWAVNPFEALEDIISIGCERILTSGQRPAAPEGAELINELIRQSDDRIIIMPGAGVRADNILHLAQKTDAVEFHTSARTKTPSAMEFVNETMKDDQSIVRPDREEIEKIIGILTSLDTSTPSKYNKI